MAHSRASVSSSVHEHGSDAGQEPTPCGCFASRARPLPSPGARPWLASPDASLIALGFGALLWVALTSDAKPRRRLIVGLIGYFALEGAVFIRYTDVVELLVVVVATLVLGRRVALSWRIIVAWLSSVALFVVGVSAFDAWAYGNATSTGYSPGEIMFSLELLAELKRYARATDDGYAMWLLAAASLTWIIVRRVRARDRIDAMAVTANRDVVVATVLALGWLGLWLLYLNYTWTVSMVSGHGGPGGGVTVRRDRFYIPYSA